MAFRCLYTVILFCLLLMPAGADNMAASPPALGRSLTGAQFFDLEGQQHDIAHVKAERMVVIFWAFWCDTWKKALPAVIALHHEKDDLQFALWTVSVDGQYTAEIRPLLETGRIPFPVLLDDESVSGRLGIRRVPTVLILNRDRKIVQAFEAYPGNAAIEKALRQVQSGKVVSH